MHLSHLFELDSYSFRFSRYGLQRVQKSFFSSLKYFNSTTFYLDIHYLSTLLAPPCVTESVQAREFVTHTSHWHVIDLLYSSTETTSVREKLGKLARKQGRRRQNSCMWQKEKWLMDQARIEQTMLSLRSVRQIPAKFWSWVYMNQWADLRSRPVMRNFAVFCAPGSIDQDLLAALVIFSPVFDARLSSIMYSSIPIDTAWGY